MAKKSTNSSPVSWQQRLQRLPLGVRRCSAWVVEVLLIVSSGVVPLGVGLYAKEHSSREAVPLNPVLTIAQDALAQTLALPVYQKNRQIAPATNFWWTAALVTPVLVAGWQICLLGVKGQTLPKRWFGVEVVTASGDSPGIITALVREGLGRWALPIVVAWAVWRYTGAYPDVGVFGAIAGFLWLGDSLSGKFHPRAQTLHDRLAKTFVIDATKVTALLPGSFPPLPPRWLLDREDSRIGEKTTGNGKTFSVNERSIANSLRRYPRQFFLMLFAGSMAIMMASFVATQIYIQDRANRRLSEQQKNQVFIVLVRQLNASANASFQERQAAILAVGAVKDDSRTVKLLVDLLGEEKEPKLIETIQQLVVKIGLDALPDLQRLNQSLAKNWDVLPNSNHPEGEKLRLEESGDKFTRNVAEDDQEYKLIGLKLRATQEAIANILVLDSIANAPIDLSQTRLSELSDRNIDRTSAVQTEANKKDENIDSLSPFVLKLDNIDLSGINFRGAILNNASFQGSRFWGAGKDKSLGTFDDWIADLSEAKLRGANLRGAILSHVSMINASLSNANFSQANLFQADLTNSNLSSAKLIGANLQQVVLKNASLAGADLTEANLSSANLQAASLNRVSAVGTQFQFADLTASNWREADVSSANFQGAKLLNANFSDAKVVGAIFSGAKLHDVSFRNADLKMADFQGADLEGVDFQGAIFVAVKINRPDGFVQSPSKVGMGTRVQGVNFSKAKNLDVRQLTYICSQGGRHPRCY